MTNIIIGLIMIASFLGLVYYCIKGYNLMVGFFVVTTGWVILTLIGNAISPVSSMEGKTVLDVLTTVYQGGPQAYAQSILVNIFFGAFFGRVLMDTGIAGTLIRKTVELGGDRRHWSRYFHCGDRNADPARTRYPFAACPVRIYGFGYGRCIAQRLRVCTVFRCARRH